MFEFHFGGDCLSINVNPHKLEVAFGTGNLVLQMTTEGWMQAEEMHDLDTMRNCK